ncbi:MAG: hypothetical protein A2665_00780 [Candidatus Zambryskibacteria bacterium RIFCSPHIGHO2_01_FULL_46_30]|uniref:Uncharacterized protein n=1 Tax=Candidatus Zambryskibacteria bacterium RIFCSPHIGHO2_01_FULL_46_30 TaxID=1802739 RepID=A0A1G2T3P8_9BACT|nr:MAG: hypothetical protein A3H83_01560 [Candidatus Roizmanbacteria bacterium RIFCSPLOWO2_02_FULL_39_8]OHA91752.1 MAG: hypothetical protein A2665_00780 [Candidatus Zambryskibacteria bacterium RIFCSPHIGHO2_01_FULL_46_30]OHB06406.1 MAG: hypothetical protein A3B22_02785 [Candidatus Zambryskibacteria bacterium RIFCSPLOWO2_01_FULL_47_33]
MFFQHKEKQGEELIKEAKKLGVATEDCFPTREVGASDIANPKLQERVRNAKNAKNARLTWIMALLSAIAAVLSAIAAWLAVLTK